MMNYIWGFMLLLGIFFAVLNGSASEFTDGLMSSCTEAVEFILTLAGIMAVWSGLMRIAEESGLIEKISHTVRPLMKYLFPHEKNDRTIAMMIMSFMANIFGAGNSATIFSLRAMELLDAENGHSRYASNAMCMFIALTMSMIQLVPVTVIKIRSDLGSASPEDIIIPSIIAGFVSMIVSVWICKLFERKNHDV
ncbi:MAG: nucleoside recognition domain-containing protein [Firmicutes bacterium]|nr:nucleoside recognition domain-containing protein [Bacillota bacterium]